MEEEKDIVVVLLIERESEEETDFGKKIKSPVAGVMNLNTLP